MAGVIGFLWTTDDQAGAVASAHIEPMVIVYWPDDSKTPEQLADTAYAALAAKPKGRRCLFHRSCADDSRAGIPQVGEVDVRDWFARSMGAVEERVSELTRFWVRWRTLGPIRPDYIICDEEANLGISTHSAYGSAVDWAGRAAFMAKVMDDAILKKRLPELVQRFTSAQIATFTAWQTDIGRAVQAWELRDGEILLNCIREIVVGTYTRAIGTPCPPMSNYGDANLDIEQRAYHFEPILPGYRTVHGRSAPPIYITDDTVGTPEFAGPPTLTKNFRWNAWLKSVNYLRALNWFAPVDGWISRPKYNGDVGADATSMVGHKHNVHMMAAMGVKIFPIWAPGLTSGELAAIESHLATVPAIQHSPGNRLPQVAYDAASVSVGGFTVNYVAGEWV